LGGELVGVDDVRQLHEVVGDLAGARLAQRGRADAMAGVVRVAGVRRPQRRGVAGGVADAAAHGSDDHPSKPGGEAR